MKNCKGFGRKRTWSNLRYFPVICLEGLWKMAKYLLGILRVTDEKGPRHLPNILRRNPLG
jgi:hypothetical protein